MSWDVILVLGGSFAMAFGVKVQFFIKFLKVFEICYYHQESGLSVWMTSCLHPLKHLSPFLANFLCLLIVCLFTQCSSNVATATIFLPILSQLVRFIHRHLDLHMIIFRRKSFMYILFTLCCLPL